MVQVIHLFSQRTGSTRIPVQSLSSSKKRVFESFSRSSAPASMKNPFLTLDLKITLSRNMSCPCWLKLRKGDFNHHLNTGLTSPVFEARLLRSGMRYLFHIILPLERRPQELFLEEGQQFWISLVQAVQLWPVIWLHLTLTKLNSTPVCTYTIFCR